ncbi:hypothetical protein Tco_0773199 [Tanacetum coccineum]|uniref:Uncharacterized protein n=1 Tax=Tanacetum coccineum TaxID=301880 RepID=A0ABQ4ZP24_9ASTR
MFYQKNVDYVALLWEDFMFQADNKVISPTRKENMPYPRFTKVIINHFISKYKTIYMRNRINLHIVHDDTLLGTLKFVSKTEDYQKYGALIPEEMINQAIKDSKAYKIYLDFATGKATPKKARKFKKIASPSQKLTTTALAKKSSNMQTTGVVIRDTPGVSVSKKKAQATVDRGKDMDLLSDVALLEAAQLKKVLKKSKHDTHMLHASRSDDGVGVPDVPNDQSESDNESWGDSGYDDDNDNDSDDDEEETQDDEFVHTPDDYVQTDDETNDESKDVDEEEYERINEELYGDVNVSLTDAEPNDKDKGDKEMTNDDTKDVEHENVIQESTGNQFKYDAQATQKTEVVYMLDVIVQHEFPCTSPLLSIPVFVIPEHNVINPPETVTAASVTTISSLLSSLFPYLQQLTPIPTPTTTEATTSTTVVPDSETLSAFHQRITDLEKDVKELKTVDHSSTLLSTIKSEVPKAVKEYLGTSLDDALHKVLQKHSADITKEHSILAENVERLRQQYVPKKSTKDIRKIKMEHAR